MQAALGRPICRPGELLRHGLPLRSAYADALGHEPLYTAANCAKAECLDFIWYTPELTAPSGTPRSSARMALSAVLGVPDLHHARRGLPSAVLPSDHVCLVADFKLSASA